VLEVYDSFADGCSASKRQCLVRLGGAYRREQLKSNICSCFFEYSDDLHHQTPPMLYAIRSLPKGSAILWTWIQNSFSIAKYGSNMFSPSNYCVVARVSDLMPPMLDINNNNDRAVCGRGTNYWAHLASSGSLPHVVDPLFFTCLGRPNQTRD
jgi:hypothetical protein